MSARRAALDVYDVLRLVGPRVSRRAYFNQFGRDLSFKIEDRQWSRLKHKLRRYGFPFEIETERTDDDSYAVVIVLDEAACAARVTEILGDPLANRPPTPLQHRLRCRFLKSGVRCMNPREWLDRCKEHRTA